MIVKVCGLKYQDNYRSIVDLDVAWVGINFYGPSSRYIADAILPPKKDEKRVGVYVRSTLEEIVDSKDLYDIDIAQLHGDEDVEFCRSVKDVMPVIKVFRIDADFAWSQMSDFGFCDYFLFDTKTIEWGGSGKKFDWSILTNYQVEVPFLLSGGIGPTDAQDILKVDHPQFVGVDINSGFELLPAMKSIDQVAAFVSELNTVTAVNK